MKRVLIVDQDAFTRNVFAQTLERRGFHVVHASSHDAATKALERESVDLVVVDEAIAGEDSVEFVAALRAEGLDASIVFLTSVFRDAALEYERLTGELGVSLVLHKPISPVEFCAQVENVFDLSQETRWLPALDDVELTEQVEASRQAYRATIHEKLLELEVSLETLRDHSRGFEETLTFLTLLRGAASRYGFFRVSRAAGRIEAALLRLTESDARVGRMFWNTVFDALDDAVLANRTLELDVDDSDRRSEASVLVLDDDPHFLDMVSRFGREHFIRVITAEDPAEAIDRLRDPQLDALLVDVELQEGFDTFEFVRRLRERSFANRLALGFIAARGTVPDRVIAAHLGASVFVEKPIDSTQFADIVHRLTSGRTQERPVVIIVDQDDGFVRETTEILHEAGMVARHVPDSQQVVEQLDDLTPDGLLVNVSMPGIGGFDLCRMIRAMPRWHDLPILLVGARMDPETRIAAFRAGADDYLSKPPIRDELLARLQVRIERLSLLREQASVDMLTGLLTRRAFLQRVNGRLSEVKRSSRSLALCLIDLDHFKEVNDTHGHIAGDRVLSGLGRLLSNRFRMEDVRGRWGGEEFTVALVDEDAHTAELVLRRTLEEFSRMVFVGDDGEKFSVTFSAGVAVFPEDGGEFRSLLEVADRRLYEAKAAGRNRIVSSTTAPE